MVIRQGRRKLIYAIIIVFAVIIAIIMVQIGIIIYSNRDILWFDDSYLKYDEAIAESFEKQHDIELIEIFDFDFDKAYVASVADCYRGEEYFREKLGVDTDTKIRIQEHENYRIFFLKDGELVYDYITSILNIPEAEDEGYWITPDATIKYISQSEQYYTVSISDKE